MKRFPLAIIVLVLFILFTLSQSLISLYPNFLWFANLGFASVFWINLKAKLLTGAAFGILFFVIAAANIFLARRLAGDKRDKRRAPQVDVAKYIRQLFGEEEREDEGFINVTPEAKPSKSEGRLWLIGILAVSFFMGLSAVTQWEVVLKALNAVSFGIADPIFGRDAGFYVFTYPLLAFVRGFIFSALVLSFLAAAWIYVVSGALSFVQFRPLYSKGVKAHLAVLLALISLVLAYGLRLGMFGILYSERGVAFGAGYTDVHAQLLGYNLQIIVLLALAAIFIIYIFRSGYRMVAGSAAAYFLVALVMGGIYPAIVQNFQVKPSEISLEAPYIKNAIEFTRIGFGLDNVEEKQFAADESLGLSDIKRNDLTISNIRLWDPRPLIKSYRQIQAIRPYYDFADVDVDRYRINGRYRQVMLAVRELKVDRLPEKAQTWVNRRLKFTHGYGLCMSPVNEQSADGQPTLMVRDIPPETKTDLLISRPEIYYGELTRDYVIVNTKEQEFDYPKGESNVYASYAGKGGVRISSWLRKLAFAFVFSDIKILLTDYITGDSRIMFDRDISRRVNKIMPFLKYDRDPYMVIAGGKLYWIQDAYTVSDRFPYSEPYGSAFSRFNYIRNSVKVVIDAYEGSVDFYVVDAADPLARTYQKIYPGLFKPFSAMPEGIKSQVRYPYDLFMVQAHKYALYHMSDPQVFYNQEDIWNTPREIYGSGEVPMDAYYTIMRLPREKREEFLLMLPFTPNNKDNMIAWLAGRSDGENYGRLIVYKFPKDRLVYGPMQIEARINQQTEIAEQFTLWSQAGSGVIRGNLLAIPIEESIIYIEPVYLEASAGALPELKRVIVAFGPNVVMAETLDRALSAVFSGRVSSGSTREKVPEYQTVKELSRRALEYYNRAQSSLKQGDLSAFGDRLRELQKVLMELAK